MPCSKSSWGHVKLSSLGFLVGNKHGPPLKPLGLLDARLTQALLLGVFWRQALCSGLPIDYLMETSRQPRERATVCISVSRC